MTFKIERNIPIPSIINNRGGKSPIYPFCQMKVGDSFLIPWEAKHPVRQSLFIKLIRSRINVASAHYRKRHNSKARFICDYEENKIVGGIRCWRTE